MFFLDSCLFSSSGIRRGRESPPPNKLRRYFFFPGQTRRTRKQFFRARCARRFDGSDLRGRDERGILAELVEVHPQTMRDRIRPIAI